MKYEIPETDYEYMLPDEANREIEKVNADTFEDEKHPYINASHPQHERFVAHMKNLFMASARKEGEPFDLGKAKAEQDEADMADLRQQHLIADGKKEAELLEKLGFEHTEIPDDVQTYQVEGLRMQRLNAQRNFQELVPLLEKEMVTLGSTGMDTFRSLVQDANISPDARAEHLELILRRIYAANGEKYGKQKPKVEAEFDDEFEDLE
jgi:hypothetical protein